MVIVGFGFDISDTWVDGASLTGVGGDELETGVDVSSSDSSAKIR